MRGVRANDSSGASRILTPLFLFCLLAERHGFDVRPRCHAERVGGTFLPFSLTPSDINQKGGRAHMERHAVPSAPRSTPHQCCWAGAAAAHAADERAHPGRVLTLSPSLSHLTDADEASTLCTFASRMSDMWPPNCERGRFAALQSRCKTFVSCGVARSWLFGG